MLVITIFVELRVVAGRSRTRSGIRLSTAVLCRGLEKNGMVRAWHGRGMVKADLHIACRAHAVPLPCRADKDLKCVFPI
jgi:hypothetical protein